MNLLKMKILLISAFILLLYGCANKIGQKFIYIKNDSAKAISFCYSENNQDTSFSCSDIGGITIFFDVNSYSTFKLETRDAYSSWDSNLKLLTIFIVDGELHDKYWQQPCDTIRKYVPVLQRYYLTLEDLKQLNFSITYPPTEAMKNMKIYPPYKEK